MSEIIQWPHVVALAMGIFERRGMIPIGGNDPEHVYNLLKFLDKKEEQQKYDRIKTADRLEALHRTVDAEKAKPKVKIRKRLEDLEEAMKDVYERLGMTP